MPDGYSSPQEAALANWPEAAGARVVQVSVVGERAQLILETDQDRPYPYYVYCVRQARGDVGQCADLSLGRPERIRLVATAGHHTIPKHRSGGDIERSRPAH